MRSLAPVPPTQRRSWGQLRWSLTLAAASSHLPSVLAGAALALVGVWWHVVLVGSGSEGFIAVFGEVGVYPSDVCVALLALTGAVHHRERLDVGARLLLVGLTLLTGAALLSALASPNPELTAALAAQLATLALAWMAVRSLRVSRTALVAGLVASAFAQAALAAMQFAVQLPLVPARLGLPWLPSDPAQPGAPVLLTPAGDRLLRGFGTFPHPNVLGGYLAMGLVCLPLLAARWPRNKQLWWGAGAVIATGLLATFSRAAWLAALVGLAIWWWPAAGQRRRRWVVPASIGLRCALFIGLSPLAPLVAGRLMPVRGETNPLELGSVENRLALDRAAVTERAAHWPRRLGAANYGQVVVAEGHQEGWGEPAPNLALLIAAELGLPGVMALLIPLIGVVRVLRNHSRVEWCLVGALFSLTILGMLDHYLWTTPLGRMIAWTPFALVGACASGPTATITYDENGSAELVAGAAQVCESHQAVA